MKNTVRVIIATITLAFVAACAETPQPPVVVKSTGEKSYHTHGK